MTTQQFNTVIQVPEDTNLSFNLVDLLRQAGHTPQPDARIDSILLQGGPGVVLADLVTVAADGTGITVTAASKPDWSGKFSVFSLVVEAGNQTLILTVAVVVTPVNDAPEGTDTTIALVDGSGYVLKEADFGFRDHAGENDAFKSVVISKLPLGGKLLLNGQALQAGAEVDIADVRAGHLVFLPPAGVSGQLAFGFQVRDTGGTAGCNASDLDGTPNHITFQLPLLNSVSGRVWIDADGNGIQDGNESSAAGVIVTLIGAHIANTTTTTASDGSYSFSGLPAGQYQVEFGGKAGYAFTSQDVGGNDSIDSDSDGNGSTAVFTLGGGSSQTMDAGLVALDPKTASIGDKVWNDIDGNGLQDAGEAGLANVSVQLLQGATVVAKTTTSASGQYNFGNLAAGQYQVVFGTRAGYTFTKANAGNDALDSDADASGKSHMLTLGVGQSDITVDAGLKLIDTYNASIGNKVWNDTNGNGVQNTGEGGIAGVTVTLMGSGRDGIAGTDDDVVVATTITNGAGTYGFSGLAAGQYQVVFSGKTGYVFTTQNAVTNDATDSDVDGAGSSDVITLAVGEANTTVDAGLKDTKTASIGDRVWYDTDGDGVQDATETGVSGVRVVLKDAGSATIATTTTDASGNYSFKNLAGGNYQVVFGTKTGYSFTTTDATSEAKDSDADANGYSHMITLAAGQSDQTVDAGLVKSICAKIVTTAGATGDVTMNEGTQLSFKVQLDSVVTQDTEFWVQIDDGSAYRTNFNASSQIVHADARWLSTDGSMTHVSKQSDHSGYAVRGSSDQSWDYGVYDTSGKIVGSSSGFYVTVKAGSTSSATFKVSAWKEFVDVDRDGSSSYGTDAFTSWELSNKVYLEDATEYFSLNLSTMGGSSGVTVCNPDTTVNIVDKSTYDVTSPIILDLDGNGVQTTTLGATMGSFDLLGNGQAVASGWASSGDGFLAIDTNGNGKIDDISELFGGRVGEGFAKLSSFDSNGDGVVNASDADFAKLLVWQDANSNHQTDAGELRTLGEAGIASLNTDNWFQNVEQNGNVLGETSTATRTDGSSIEMIDAYFKYAELPALDSLVEADNALFDSVLGGGSAREQAALADIGFDAASEAQRVIAEAMKQADATLAVTA